MYTYTITDGPIKNGLRLFVHREESFEYEFLPNLISEKKREKKQTDRVNALGAYMQTDEQISTVNGFEQLDTTVLKI